MGNSSIKFPHDCRSLCTECPLLRLLFAFYNILMNCIHFSLIWKMQCQSVNWTTSLIRNIFMQKHLWYVPLVFICYLLFYVSFHIIPYHHINFLDHVNFLNNNINLVVVCVNLKFYRILIDLSFLNVLIRVVNTLLTD